MVIASGSSAKHRVHVRLRPDLSLIAYGEGKRKIVLEYSVKKQCPNHGRIFYRCLDRKVSSLLVTFSMVYIAIFMMILINVLDFCVLILVEWY
jgi:hypothetical protein